MLQYGRQATNPPYNYIHQIMIGMLSLNVPDKHSRYAATFPAFSEAQGIAAAMAKTGMPYMLSFVIRRDGTLLDVGCRSPPPYHQ